jgi:hypothetical protein
MPSKYFWRKLKKKTGALVLTTAGFAATITGAAGLQVGRDVQLRIDQPVISSYEGKIQQLNDKVTPHEREETALDEFLFDLKGHLAAAAELETLFKAGDLNWSRSLAGAISSGDAASVECCKEEVKRIAQYYKNGSTNKDPRVRTLGGWLDMRCSYYFAWRPSR